VSNERTRPIANRERDYREPMAPPWRFSTRGADLRPLIDQGLLPVEPLADRPIEVELMKWRLPGASILAGTLAGVRQTGDPSSAAVRDPALAAVRDPALAAVRDPASAAVSGDP